jgi:hypothetical protein
VQGSERDIWINDAYIVDGDHLAQNGEPIFTFVSFETFFDLSAALKSIKSQT